MSNFDPDAIAQALVELSKAIPEKDFADVCNKAIEMLEEKGRSDLKNFPGRVVSALEKQDSVVFAHLFTPSGDSGELKERLHKKIEKALGRKVHLRESKDPTLLGGAVLHVGDEMYDTSIRSDINALTEYFLQPLVS
ncbi:MAG: F0F1 ATP synthase subunit delta [Candidatus Peribacteraceae bacterium]|nr:F0F1 ATP synthase subunit delta [Candidatus Peribacteraceae bacterium]